MSQPYYQDEHVTLHHGDALAVLAGTPDGSVDAVVTDPPYALGFMGKSWDTFGKDVGRGAQARVQRAAEVTPTGQGHATSAGPYLASGVDSLRAAGLPFQQWCESWARECLRVLKPGGHLLAFGGTRTWHRLAVGVEDAGFEIRDSLAWLYGSGFPKSLDVSKAIDKAAGHWRGKAGEVESANGSMTGANYERTDKGDPVTAAAAAAAGWGTALKPAFEPIVVGRKPLIGTVAANFIAHGTGALNIDATRIATSDGLGAGSSTRGQIMSGGWRRPWMDDPESVAANAARRRESVARSEALGRWPANLLLDESQAAALDQSADVTTSRIGKPRGAAPGDGWGMTATGAEYADSGGPSRFFFVAKADSDERPRVNGVAHPTVKPLDLMRWLVRLVTPPGGVVVDPFAGSGTTVEACILEGLHCLAIERESDYLPLIVSRIHRRRDPVEAIKITGDDMGLFAHLEGEGA
jgi:DNA modification methylase